MSVPADDSPLSAPAPEASASPDRLVSIELDETSMAPQSHQIDHERRVAIFDLLEGNSFALVAEPACPGPFHLRLSIQDQQRLVIEVFQAAEGEVERSDQNARVATHILALSPFKKIIKDYFLVCESYFEAIKTAPPQRIEALDMGRRGLHNEGCELLIARLEGKVTVDYDTARRLFTLLSALHWKG